MSGKHSDNKHKASTCHSDSPSEEQKSSLKPGFTQLNPFGTASSFLCFHVSRPGRTRTLSMCPTQFKAEITSRDCCSSRVFVRALCKSRHNPWFAALSSDTNALRPWLGFVSYSDRVGAPETRQQRHDYMIRLCFLHPQRQLEQQGRG